MINAHKGYGIRLILRFLIPSVLILVIPLAVGISVYHQTVVVMREESVQNSVRVLEKSKETLDGRLKEVEMIVRQLATNSHVNGYVSVTHPFEGATAYRTYRLSNELYDYSQSNYFIYDYFIYYKNSDLVVSSKRVYRNQSFREKFYSLPDGGDWGDFLAGRYYHAYLPSRPMQVAGQTREMVMAVHSLGLSKTPSGAIVVLIDNEEIKSVLRGLVVSKDGWAYIADREGNIISSVAAGPDAIEPIPRQSVPRGLIDGSSRSGENMMTAYTTSDYNGWTYVVAQPASVVWDKVNYVKRTTLTALLFALAVGIVLAFVQSYRNSKPLQTILNMVTDRLGGAARAEKDTFGVIGGAMSRLIDNNEELTRRIKEQMPILKRTFMERLMQGEFASGDDLERMLHQVGIDLSGHCHTVVILNLKPLQSDVPLEELMEIRVLAKEAVNQMFGENVLIHDLDEERLVLLLTCRSERGSVCRNGIRKATAGIAAALSGRLDAQIVLAVGGTYREIGMISHSFEEARKAMNHRCVFSGRTLCIHYDDLSGEAIHRHYYPAEVENKLLNCVRVGEVAETQKLLDAIYRENFIVRQLPLPVLRLLLYDMTASFAKLTAWRKADLNRMLTLLEEFKDPESLFPLLTAICQEECRANEEQKKSRNVQLKHKILEHIHAAYTNSDLCLASVADDFNITEVYLSSFFKEQTGVNFSDYLETLRMEKAKQLLRDTNLPINHISLQVGYQSSTTFIRAFKRLHGVSATAFKKFL